MWCRELKSTRMSGLLCVELWHVGKRIKVLNLKSLASNVSQVNHTAADIVKKSNEGLEIVLV